MEIKLDGTINPELKDFLLSQEGITNVEINYDDYFIKLNVKFNEKTNSNIVMKYIELFEKYKYSNLVEFNKEYEGKIKTLKYIIDDMCCEYCYMGLVMDLFENDRIKSVKSNFDFKMPAFNIEFTIEYDEKYKEEDLIKYIKAKYN
jgi:copper chaperone CopZ